MINRLKERKSPWMQLKTKLKKVRLLPSIEKR